VAGQAPRGQRGGRVRQSNNTRQGTVGYGGQIGDTSFNVTGSMFKTDGFSSINRRQWNADNPLPRSGAASAEPATTRTRTRAYRARSSTSSRQDWDAGFAYYSNNQLSYDNTCGKPTDDNRMDSELYTLSAFVNESHPAGPRISSCAERGP
jgi:vitamin B12 transporter